MQKQKSLVSTTKSTTDAAHDVGQEQKPVAIRFENVDVLFGHETQQQAALQLLDANKTREEILAQTGVVLGVADATLAVPEGSISVLMGLSGSGKSSLLRCVNGLNCVTRGVLSVRTSTGVVNVAASKGRALRDLRRNNLAMVFQQFGLLPWASVRENIGFGLSVRGEAPHFVKQRVDEQLTLVGLEAWADKPIHELSGGMQQRVGLARAFATDADILLMDEPFSALDPLIREHLQDELLTLQSRLKKTILFVSHDLDEALKIGNQISIMEGGYIVQTGSVDEIVFSPASDYVQRFVANINPLSVLTAGTIMHQPVNPSENSLVDDATGLSVRLKQGVPLNCRLQGEDYPLVAFDTDKQQQYSGKVVCVDQFAPVKTLLRLAANSELPIIVVGSDQRLKGFIDVRDLCKALAG